MADKQTYVIVGANTAGGSAAHALRKEGFDGRIVLIGEEPDRPYERPPLSKEYLRGDLAKEKVYLKPADFYAENDIELRLGQRVERLDITESSVELGGDRVAYDKLLIATGGRPRKLPVDGADLDGVYYLRDFADADRIAAELEPGKRLAVVGAGFIGSEAAASAREKGLDVTIIEMEEAPLALALGPEVGKTFAGLHRDHGVNVMLGAKVERLEGDGRVQRVVTSAGDSVDCDFVVVGVGIEPATELVDGTDIEADDGIIVDEHCRTNVENVYAAGDVARWKSPLFGGHLRVEHWDNALNQGAAAAAGMLGSDEAYDPVPWFWSDQYDVNAQYAGHTTDWDEIAFRGSVDDRKFSAWYLKDGKARAVFAMNAFKDIRFGKGIISSGVAVDAKTLSDPDTDLKALAAG